MFQRVAFVAILATLALLTSRGGVVGQDKSKKGKASALIEATEKAPGNWIFIPAKVGAKVISDRDYLIKELPKELEGSTYLLRSSDDFKNWLKDAHLNAKKKLTVYVMISIGKNGEQFDEVAQSAIEKDGWEKVEGKASNTWGGTCVVYKKVINEGLVFLALEKLTWNTKNCALFFFKPAPAE